MKLEFVGQPSFSFRIPSAPLFSGIPWTKVRVQTQGFVLFDGVVEQSKYDIVLEWLRSPRMIQEGIERQLVAVGVGSRVDWTGFLMRYQIDMIISCLKGGACLGIPLTSPTTPFVCPTGTVRVGNQCVPTRRSSRTFQLQRTVAGFPNTLGDVAAGVSVGGGLLGLAVLALAGYGVYKLVT
jgi:hypothetical protein